MNFDDVLRIEGNPKVWSYRFQRSGVPIYLAVRFFLLQMRINDAFGLSNPYVSKNDLSLKNLTSYVISTIRYNPFFYPKKDILVFSSGIVSVLDGDVYVNRLYQLFNDSSNNRIQIIESSNKRQYGLPKKSRTYFRDLLDIFINLGGRFVRNDSRDIETINKFIDYLTTILDSELEVSLQDDIKNILQRSEKKNIVGEFVYKVLLKLKKPKLIILEDAHYGQYSYLISVAKSQGIKVVEFQHGYIGLAHPAYNFDLSNLPVFAEAYLPDYFLTHGEYWAVNCRLPAQKRVIGYPHLIEQVKKFRCGMTKNILSSKTRILFISGGTVPKILVETISGLVKILGLLNYEIVLRPHPSELPEVQKRYQSIINLGVTINTSSLYEVLSEVNVVVSLEVSTVLYEAVFFTNQIFISNTDYTRFYEPKISFLLFDSIEDLSHKIAAGESMAVSEDYFWEKNWHDNFEKFLIEVAS